MVKDLSEDIVLDLVEALEGGLEGGLILGGGAVEVLVEAVGGAVHEHLGVLEALGVPGEAELDELGVVLDLLEGRAGAVGITVEHLLAGDFGHGRDELGVEEALFARIGLQGALLKLIDGLLVEEEAFVDACGAGGGRQGKK